MNFQNMPNFFNGSPYSNRLAELQREYQTKLTNLQNEAQAQMSMQYGNTNQQLQVPNANPVQDATSQPSNNTGGSVPPHMQVLAAVGEVKAVLLEIKEVLAKTSDEVKTEPESKEDKKEIKEVIIAETEKTPVHPKK